MVWESSCSSETCETQIRKSQWLFLCKSIVLYDCFPNSADSGAHQWLGNNPAQVRLVKRKFENVNFFSIFVRTIGRIIKPPRLVAYNCCTWNIRSQINSRLLAIVFPPLQKKANPRFSHPTVRLPILTFLSKIKPFLDSPSPPYLFQSYSFSPK